MMREPCHRPDDFDDNGLLKAPVLFWGGLVMLARTVLPGCDAAVVGTFNRSAGACHAVLLSGSQSVSWPGQSGISVDAGDCAGRRGV